MAVAEDCRVSKLHRCGGGCKVSGSHGSDGCALAKADGGAGWGQRLQESGGSALEVGMVIDISTWVVTPRGVLGASDRVAQCQGVL